MSLNHKLSLSSDSEHTAFVIQARMRSTRLPGKVLSEFCGKPMLKFQIDLLRKNNLGIDIIVATSTNEENGKIEELCVDNNVQCIRENENNVIQRFYRSAQLFSLKHIIRLTGDNPLPNLNLIRFCLNKHLRDLPDLTSTRQILKDRSIMRYVPKGLSVDILNCKTLLSLDYTLLTNFEREHVIPVFFRDGYTVNIVSDYKTSLPELSVDTIGDFKRVSSYAQNLLNKGQLLNTLGYN